MVYESVAVYLWPDGVFVCAPMPICPLKKALFVKVRKLRNPAHVWRGDDFECFGGPSNDGRTLTVVCISN